MIANDSPVPISTQEPENDPGMQRDQGKSISLQMAKIITGWRGSMEVKGWLVYRTLRMNHNLRDAGEV